MRICDLCKREMELKSELVFDVSGEREEKYDICISCWTMAKNLIRKHKDSFERMGKIE